MEKQKIMSIGSHADDIEAATGGLLAKFHDQHYEIVYIMSTNNMSGNVRELQPDGSFKNWKETPIPMMKRRKRECDDAAALLDTKPIHLDHPQRHYNGKDGKQIELRYNCDLPEGVPENVPSILTAYEDKKSRKRLVDLILENDPACIFSHGLCSGNIEHVATSLLVTKSYWEASDAGYKGALLNWREDYTSFGLNNTQWDTFIDISDYLDKKMELLGKHACQMPTAHYPDHGHRLRALKRGVACGCKAAEIFTWVSHDRRPDLDGTLPFYSPLLAELNHHTK
ncbi:PIG-L deacetylase family protein [Verrucomicrobiota bacterium]